MNLKNLFVLVLITFASLTLNAQDSTISQSQAETAIANTPSVSGCANRVGAATPIPCPPPVPLPSADTNSTPITSDINSTGNSVIENYSFNHIHFAWDWQTVNFSEGCTTCGDIKQSYTVPTVELKRYHRFRDVHEQGSFGPGVFSNYDVSLQLTTEGTGSKIIMFDPGYYWRIQFEDGLYGDTKDGVFYEDLRPSEKARIVDKLSLYDGPLGTGNLTSDINLAQSAVVRNLHGKLFYFQIIAMGSGELSGRLVRWEDRRGYGVDISYKSFTPAEIAASPSRQFQMDTVSDANGRVASFEYHPTQVASKWVISEILLPNNQQVTYSYSGGYLTGIQHPDGTQSQFTFGLNVSTNCTTIQYNDAAADTTHRHKTVYLTNNFNFGGSNYGTSFTSSSSLLVRMVLNGSNEVSYLNLFPSGQSPLIYEGGHQVKQVQVGAYINYMSKGWVFNPLGQTRSAMFPGTTFNTQGGSNIIGSIEEFYRNTPVEYVDENGVIFRMLYDTEGYLIQKKRYYDNAIEDRTYNSFKQLTRTKDMEGRVELMTYDSKGNMIQKEVGIKVVAGIDTHQPEYAIYQWEYYPSGHPNQFLEKAFIDANGNRTEYIYNSQQFLVQEIQAKDNTGDANAAITYFYDTYGRLSGSSDPLGRLVQMNYDLRDRRIKTIYSDTSTDKFIYGAPGSGNENLIVKKVDRNGNITEFDFDSNGRTIKTTVGQLTMDLAGNIATVTNPLTKIEEICTYLIGTNHAKTTCLKAGELSSFTYDLRNRWVTKTVQPNTAKTLTYTRTYTTGNLLRDETDPYGRRTIYAYSWITAYLYRIIQETVPGNVIDYNTLYAVYGVNTPNAPYIVTSFVKDLDGLTTQTTDPRGIKQLKAYDSRRRVTSSIEGYTTAQEAKTVFVYDANSNVIEVQKPRHFDATDPEFGKCKTTMTYTGRNLLKSRTEGAGSTVQATESFAYYLDKREKTHTDFNGNIWTTIWHICCGRLEAKVDPLGNGTLFDVDYAGNVVHTTSGSGFPLDATLYVCNNQPVTALNEITTRYDERNRPTHSTVWLQPLGAITNKGRPSLGNGQIPIAGEDSVPASQGLTTRYRYDDNLADGLGLDVDYAANLVGLNLGANSDGSAVEVTNPEGEKTLIVRDGLGREIKSVDGVGHEKQMVFDNVVSGLVEVATITAPNTLALTSKAQVDAIGRVQKVIDAENQISINEYDNNSNRTKSLDANGVGLTCVFDNRNRDTSCADTQGTITYKTFDKNNNTLTQKDGMGKITSFIFDARDRQKSSTNRIGSVVTNVFDGNSNLLSVTDGQNNTTNYVYNVRNLQTERIFADSQDATDKVVFTYDAVRRKTSQLDQKGDLISYQFDMANRMLQRQYPDNLNDVFSYDSASRLTQAVSNRYQNTVTRSYNDDSTVATEGLTTNSQSYQISHLFDTAKRKYQTVYPNGKVLSQTFTARNQLASVSYDAQSIAGFLYDNGMRETTRSLGNGLTQSTVYRPDNLISQKSVAGVTNYSYTYDNNKRKLTETDGTMSSLSQTFAYDFEDRLASWTSNGSTLNTSQSWNLSLEGAWLTNTVNNVAESRTFNQAYETLTSNANALTHDRKGNLTTNKDGSVYTWDFDNQLSASVNSTNISASYTYDALGRRVSKTSNNTITVFVNSEYQILTEYSSISNAPFAEVQSFVYATYIDDPIALINSNGKYFYHSNNQFSIGAITDSVGNLTERFGYNAYGKPITITDSILVNNEYFFTGRQLDSETGLFYFRARYYDSSLGQFISRDPIGYIDGMNLYRGYFANNGVDWSGEENIFSGSLNGNTLNILVKYVIFSKQKDEDLIKLIERLKLVGNEGELSFTVNFGGADHVLKLKVEGFIGDPINKDYYKEHPNYNVIEEVASLPNNHAAESDIGGSILKMLKTQIITDPENPKNDPTLKLLMHEIAHNIGLVHRGKPGNDSSMIPPGLMHEILGDPNHRELTDEEKKKMWELLRDKLKTTTPYSPPPFQVQNYKQGSFPQKGYCSFCTLPQDIYLTACDK